MMKKRPILITGGAGFIGANFVHDQLMVGTDKIVNLDKLTYAGNYDNLRQWTEEPRHIFVRGDIGDRDLIGNLLHDYHPWAIVNFAAESHVDRSIAAPGDFIHTNVVGTYNLLDAARHYWDGLPAEDQSAFRFLHVSTDEVYGSLPLSDPPFRETSAYSPNSPYSASKAAADHLVRAYHYSYGLPTLTTNCSNNYGPYQFPEKLIPLVIHNALKGQNIPIYGDGGNIRDWLYVIDHCRAIRAVLEKGRVGEVYNIGANSEKTNLEVVHAICAILDRQAPRRNGMAYDALITLVPDRPGHDRRYAIDATKIHRETGWAPTETFATGIDKTVRWYLQNNTWMQNVTTDAYQKWIEANYGQRK